MKKLIAIGLAGLLFSGAASAQGALLGALLGPQGVVGSLDTSLTTMDAEPLVNSAAGANSGLIQGTTGLGLNQLLGGLLISQDPMEAGTGLYTIVGVGLVGPDGVTDQLLGVDMLGGFDGELPGLGGAGLPGLDGLPVLGGLLGGLPNLGDGALPGLPGGDSGLSALQLQQVSGLLSR